MQVVIQDVQTAQDGVQRVRVVQLAIRKCGVPVQHKALQQQEFLRVDGVASRLQHPAQGCVLGGVQADGLAVQMEPAVAGAGAAADPAQAQKGEELLQYLELVVALTGTQNIQAAACVQAVQADKVRLGVGTVGHAGLGLLVGLAKALVQLVQRVGAAVQAGGVAVEFGGRDPGKLFDRLALNGGKLGTVLAGQLLASSSSAAVCSAAARMG